MTTATMLTRHALPLPELAVDLDDPDALVMPAFWHCPEYAVTIGPEVCDLVTLFGRSPNPEQRMLLDGTFGMDRRGRLTAFEVFVLASRQNLKTGFFEFRALGKALLLKRPLQIWTAHKESATDQALIDLKEMIANSDELSRRVRAITEGKGDKSIEFMNGCRIVFRPRTGKAGQSMSADDVDLDEYFAVEPKHLGSLVPTLSTRANPQIGEASSAPHAASHEQRSIMARGRGAAEGRLEEPRLLYAEWSVQRNLAGGGEPPRYGPPPCRLDECAHLPGVDGCIADRRELVKLANPSVGRSSKPSISWEFIADERRKLASPDAIVEHFRERLGAGDEGAGGAGGVVFPPGTWGAAGTTTPTPTPGAIGIGVSLDMSWGSIGTAGKLSDGRLYLGATDRRRGTDWLPSEAKRIQDEHDVVVVIDEKCPDPDLEAALRAKGVRVLVTTLDDYVSICANVVRRLMAGTLAHGDHDDLNDAVDVARWRSVGDRRIFGRRQSTDDISMLEGAALATWPIDTAPTDAWGFWT